MANRFLNPTRALEKELTTLVGRITINASAAITASSGRGWSAAKTGTGEYTVTLQDKWSKLLGVAFAQIGTGTIVTTPELKSEDVAGASAKPNFVIKTVTRSTGVTADTGVAFDLLFTLKLRNSSVV